MTLKNFLITVCVIYSFFSPVSFQAESLKSRPAGYNYDFNQLTAWTGYCAWNITGESMGWKKGGWIKQLQTMNCRYSIKPAGIHLSF